MEFTNLFSQFLSGITYGMILFLVGAGLSLIFGVMNILNFAHATLWLIGAYFCYSFWSVLQGYGFALWLSIPLAALATAAVGWVTEILLIRRIYKRELHEQLLITYALALIFGDLIKIVWGPTDRLIVRPPIIQKPVYIFGAPLDSYFVFVILVGFAVACGLWWFLKYTRYGHIVKAAVFSREMVSALGIPIPRIFTWVFTLGIFVAGLAGGIQAAIGSVTLGMDISIIIQAFCVVVIGGFGSLAGTLVGSLIVGEVFSFAILYWPDGAMVLIFCITAAILIIRPWGLFGTAMRA
ncbi:MAG: branched-chain amino acid ABC transporter permease [Syntrophorhabdales bacterium]|jgi:branched-chain amino acid transport system permease protein